MIGRETWCRGRLRSFALIADLGEVLSSGDWLSDVPVRDIVHDADLGREFHAFADERLRARALEFLHDANIWLPDEQPPARREESDE